MKYSLTRKQVLEILKNFIDGRGGEWDWDDFISIPLEDSYLEAIRLRCAGLPEEFPPGSEKGYCSSEGIKILEDYVKNLQYEEEKNRSDQEDQGHNT